MCDKRFFIFLFFLADVITRSSKQGGFCITGVVFNNGANLYGVGSCGVSLQWGVVTVVFFYDFNISNSKS